METRIPLTLVNVQYHTGAPRRKAEAWLDELTRTDVTDMVVGNDGEVYWKVNGARRPVDGPVTFEQWRGGKGPPPVGSEAGRDASDDLMANLDRIKSSLGGAMAVRDAKHELTRPKSEGDRSMLVSGGVSLVLGPLGWLYAGAWREAIPASAIYLFLVWLLPFWMLFPILGVVAPVSAIAGLMYAFKYNRAGHKRQPILPRDKDRD